MIDALLAQGEDVKIDMLLNVDWHLLIFIFQDCSNFAGKMLHFTHGDGTKTLSQGTKQKKNYIIIYANDFSVIATKSRKRLNLFYKL